jgi:hypothetical protein
LVWSLEFLEFASGPIEVDVHISWIRGGVSMGLLLLLLHHWTQLNNLLRDSTVANLRIRLLGLHVIFLKL